MKQYIYSALIVLGLASSAMAKENIGVHRMAAPPQGGNQIFSGCAPSKSRADLDINNVRCPIWINGDMWWDLVGNAEYEIPVGSKKHSLFSGAIWIGGKDQAQNLRVSAQTYRQSGNDFWPGPIDNTGSVGADVCLKYDQHWKITFADVKAFHEQYQIAGDLTYAIPDVIKNWPGNGDAANGYSASLAPYYDRSNDGYFDLNDGDYPRYNVDGSLDPCDKSNLLGDQTIWWVFNDVGNIHTETNSVNPVGVEIQAQAFGFNTNDEVNNMTFYRYKIINRSTNQLNETYFGSWIDPDLGNYIDDFVGCDVARGLGYCYNGDADDDGALGYGLNPPAVGVDFFEGPLADTSDHIDNNRNGDTDEVGEQIIMSKFVYYNNDFTPYGNPVTAQHYYNYLKGIWKDNNPLVYGGNGYLTAGAPNCDFMFPGDSDPKHYGTAGVSPGFDWTERVTAASGGSPNTPGDRRFLQSAGAFTLRPGAVNFITTGVVWARGSSGGPEQSIKLLKLADVKAQNLFQSCFKVINGPDAPSVNIRELDKEIILSIKNLPNSNNYKEQYTEPDINIPVRTDAIFRFQGYKIFQVHDASISVNDLTNADKARLIFQCDLKDGVSQIINQAIDGNINAFVPVEMVAGADNGLRHTFRISTDAFATGDPNLVNHKTYYYMAIAYGYDSVADVGDPWNPALNGIYGQPYVQSRKNSDGTAISIYTAIPHIIAPEANGLELSTSYGDGPEITRYTGKGNGYIIGSDRSTLDLKLDQLEGIFFNSSNPSNIANQATYERARGPVDIRIYDPVKVPQGNFEIWLTDTVASVGRWVLKNMDSGVMDTAEKTIENPYDQLFPDYGFYVNMTQVSQTGESQTSGNGYIESNVVYATSGSRWYSGLPDIDNGFEQFNWILSGAAAPNQIGLDDSKFYQKVLNGTFAPFVLANQDTSKIDFPGDRLAPIPVYDGSLSARKFDKLKYLNSVDIIITKDKSKWSKCVVFETQNNRALAEGGQYGFLLRKHASVDINGNPSATDQGMGWFPGYAVNIETGERLNIAFGEDSYLTAPNYPDETGNDMLWNPTSKFYGNDGRLIGGGKHFIYVFGNKADNVLASESADGNAHSASDTSYWGGAYDGCQHINYLLNGMTNPTTTTNKKIFKKVWKDVMWVGCPIVANGQTYLSSDVRLRIRVSKPYRKFDTGVTTANSEFPYYKFSTNDLVAKVSQTEVAKNALSLVNVVPNPYYAYSNYELNQLDNRIKITNLPNKCTVSIYTVGGTLIRQFKRDTGFNNSDGGTTKTSNLETSLDWDMKNSKNIPIASGMYLIHVEADGIGERTIKWFGVMRPIDLDTF